MILRSGKHWDKVSPLLTRPGGISWSEKLDGHRVFWDGGVSVGMSLRTVPWSNMVKHSGKKGAQTSSGVWSRYCNTISLPPQTIELLQQVTAELISIVSPLRECPKPILDMEVWSHRGPTGLGVVKSATGVDTWSDRYNLWLPPFGSERVGLVIHDVVPPSIFAKPRTGPHGSSVTSGASGLLRTTTLPDPWDRNYAVRRGWLDKVRCLRDFSVGDVLGGDLVYRLKAYLPSGDIHPEGREEWHDHLDVVLALGGEGLMVQELKGVWRPVKADSLLKIKVSCDDHAIVVGVQDGKDGFEGMIGALVCDWTPADRPDIGTKRILIGGGIGFDYAARSKGSAYWIGQTVSFTYLGITPDDMPREPKLILRDLDV